MKQVIQLRGTFATGKTSTARSVLAHGNFEKLFIEIHGREYPYNYDAGKRWVVTGQYDKNECGGLDGIITDKQLLKHYLYKLMRQVKPDVILFEAVMYGMSLKFGLEIDSMCRKAGYKYTGVLLSPDFEVVMANLYRRNGGKPMDEVEKYNAWRSALVAQKKLHDMGVKTAIEDSSKYSLDDMYMIVDKYVVKD